MNYLQIKNYKNFKDIKLNIGITNFIVGDNNIGKTSLLRLIESLLEIDNINLTSTSIWGKRLNTYLSKQTTYNLFLDEKEPLEIFMSNFSEKNKNPIIFEFFKITEFGTTNIPIISEIIVNSDEENKICKFNFEFFTNFENKDQKKPDKIKKITLKTYNFENIEEFKKTNNKIETIKKILEQQKPEEYEPITFSENYINNIDNEIKKIYKIRHKLKSNKDYVPLDLIKFVKSGIEIEHLYSRYIFLFNKKNEYNHESNVTNKKYSVRRAFQEKVEFITYVKGFRENFNPIYFFSDLNNTERSDIASIDELEKDNKKIEMINNFFKKTKMIETIEIKNNSLNNSRLIQPIYKKFNKEIDLSNSGSGISQIIPVLLALKNKEKDKTFIEQPEIHLHPKAQSSLGKEIGNYYIQETKTKQNKTSFNKQLFIETHSLYMIDSFRHKLFSNNKNQKNNLESFASIIFLDKNNNSYTTAENLMILNNGKIRGNVKKFNKFFIDETIRIMEI